MAMSAKAGAAWLKKFAALGINTAIVESGLQALELDKRESIARAHKITGKMASTIRVIKPSSRSKAALEGKLIFRLGAGRKGGDASKVPYARVQQTGTVYGSSSGKTKAHIITPRGGEYSGPPGAAAFRTRGVVSFTWRGARVAFRHVQHPGSKFTPHPYLGMNEARFTATVDRGVQTAAERTAAQASDFEGLGL